MKKHERTEYKINEILRIIYILSFNIYSWYWLYKIIFINKSNWEDYLNWFFVVVGVHFFAKDHKKFWSKDVKKISDIINPDIK